MNVIYEVPDEYKVSYSKVFNAMKSFTEELSHSFSSPLKLQIIQKGDKWDLFVWNEARSLSAGQKLLIELSHVLEFGPISFKINLSLKHTVSYEGKQAVITTLISILLKKHLSILPTFSPQKSRAAMKVGETRRLMKGIRPTGICQPVHY